MRYKVILCLTVAAFLLGSLNLHASEKKTKQVNTKTDAFKAALNEGITFSEPNYPSIIKSVTGVSEAESNGRWTDGKKAIITFTEKLPERFKLHIESKGAFGPNENKSITVIIGNWKGSITIKNDTTKPFVLDVKTSKPQDTIEFVIPEPTSPADLKINSDPRKLGFWLTRLSIQ